MIDIMWANYKNEPTCIENIFFFLREIYGKLDFKRQGRISASKKHKILLGRQRGKPKSLLILKIWWPDKLCPSHCTKKLSGGILTTEKRPY